MTTPPPEPDPTLREEEIVDPQPGQDADEPDVIKPLDEQPE